jgi:site-specific DNA-methyltransferase (adenine-specific)
MPEPYYEDDLVQLYHGDCREVTAWLEADVLVTDPPYGRGWYQHAGLTDAKGQGSSKAHDGIANDQDTGVRDAALSLWGDERRAIVFGDPLIAPPVGARQALVYAKPFDAGVKGARAGFRRDVEMLYLLGSWGVGVGGRSSILTTSAVVAGPRGLAVRYEHPHAKPVDLIEGLLGYVLPHPVVIADPFVGSGSLLVAARHQGHRAIGVELEEEYCEIAAKRLAQDTLFGGVA